MEFEEEVKKYFKDLLECPICFETIDSVPIYQCRNGHVVCKNCHPKLKTCPICRVDIIKKSKRNAPMRNRKLEEMVERLQLSVSEATKKLVTESIQIDPILPETQNVQRDTNQEPRQDSVQLNIVEDNENVISEPCCECCDSNVIFGLFGIIFGVTMCFFIGCSIYAVTVAGGGAIYNFWLTIGLIISLFLVYSGCKVLLRH